MSDQLLVKYDPKKERERIKNRMKAICDPDIVIQELNDLVAKKGKSETEEQKLKEKMSEAVLILNLDNHVFLSQSVHQHYAPMAMEMAEHLVKEFRCEGPSERMYVHLIVNAYIRVMTLSHQMTNTLGLGQVTPQLNNFLGYISKEIDRAERQFITAMDALKRLRNPELKVSIKANTTFVAQNQQINNNPSTHEIIEPQ